MKFKSFSEPRPQEALVLQFQRASLRQIQLKDGISFRLPSDFKHSLPNLRPASHFHHRVLGQ